MVENSEFIIGLIAILLTVLGLPKEIKWNETFEDRYPSVIRDFVNVSTWFIHPISWLILVLLIIQKVYNNFGSLFLSFAGDPNANYNVDFIFNKIPEVLYPIWNIEILIILGILILIFMANLLALAVGRVMRKHTIKRITIQYISEDESNLLSEIQRMGI